MGENQEIEQASSRTRGTSRGICYEDWKDEIQRAPDLDQLVRIVGDYLATWRYDQLRCLPLEVSATALASSMDIAARAVIAAQAELKADARTEGRALLREMALTMMAAATRMRLLASLRSRAQA
jgi:hypothetical protein